jgi:adenylylsulfate kinase
MQVGIRQEQRNMKHKGITVWFTGLSGAGKTTIARSCEKELQNTNLRVEVLDGDLIRQRLCPELGFSHAERMENVRRIGFIAQLLSRNGVIVLVSAIAPHRVIRQELRQNIGDFIEVYVNAPLDICERRDVKGLYQKARSGLIENFTGIDMSYEIPLAPEVECQTDRESVEQSTNKVLQKLKEFGFVCINP